MAKNDRDVRLSPVQRVFENPHKASEWRKRAERLRALAKTTRNERQRDELLELAGQWENMAAQADMYARHGHVPSSRTREPTGQ